MNEDLFSVSILGDRNLIRNLDSMPDTVRAILVEKMKVIAQEMADKVSSNAESRLNKSDKPKEYSGSSRHIKDAVQTRVEQLGDSVEAKVFISGIPYARVQDEGGVIPPHMIYPSKARVLAWVSPAGEEMFARRVSHPGATIPATNYMKDAYRDSGPQISRAVKNAVVQGIRAKMRSGL